MQINSTSFAAPQSAAPSAGSPPAAGTGESSAFARMLSAHEAARKEPSATADDTEARTQRSNDTQRRAEAKRGESRRAETRDKEPSATAQATPGESADTSPDAAASTPADTPPEAAAVPSAPESMPAEWLAALARPAAPPPPAVATGGGAVAGADAAVRPAGGRAEKAKDAPELSLATADAAAADKGNAFRESLERATEEVRPVAGTRSELPRIGEAAAAVVGHVHGGARPEAPAAPVAVALPTPATSPEFREALGVQVSMLAKDGVQRAELQLNPAEMGPISVHIALDGTQAQVDFGAASLATRQIIEAGLPELAAALRDAGLTLAGGGVSQHAGGHAQGEGSSQRGQASADRADAAIEPAVSRRVTVRMPQGAVDLYA